MKPRFDGSDNPTSSYELDTHYEFHDDMEYRHHRDTHRTLDPGISQTQDTTAKIDLRTSPIHRGSALDRLGVRKIKYPGTPDCTYS